MAQSSHGHGNKAPAPPKVTFYLAMIWVCLIGLVGGATQFVPLNDIVVRVASAGMLGLAGWHLVAARPDWRARCLLGLGAAGVLVIGWQMIPLPEAWTASLPGRGRFLEDLQAMGIDARFPAASVSPDLTVDALLSSLPLLAAIALGLLLPLRLLRHVLLAIVGVGLASVAFGAVQFAAGNQAVEMFATANAKSRGYGFFANRNHWAAYLVCCIPLALFWISTAPASVRQSGSWRWIAASVPAGTILLCMAGIAISASRAGMILLALGLTLCGAIMLLTSQAKRRFLVAGVTAGVTAMAAVAISLTGGWAALERFTSDDNPLGRTGIWAEVGPAVATYWPVGSGGETLSRVMLATESVASIDPTFINRAHNEYMAIAFEHGLAGLIWLAALAATVLICAALRLKSLAGQLQDEARRPQALSGLRRLLLLLTPMLLLALHSAVDYPVRTASIGMMFAFLVAMVVLDRPAAPVSQGGSRRGA